MNRSPRPLARLPLVSALLLQSLSSCTVETAVRDQASAVARQVEWVVACRVGEDGFASNCVATAQAEPLTLRLSTADSQLSVSVLHPGCDEVRYFDRVDVIGLTRNLRAQLVADAFADAARSVHEKCPHLPVLVADFTEAPDIAMIGDVQ